MRLRPKTARRLLLLLVLVLIAGVSAGGLFVVRKWQNQRRIEGYRAAGMSRLEAKQYPEAVDNLGRYIRRSDKDAEAWLAYSKARENVEEANGSHLAQAASALQKALAFGAGTKEDSLHLATLFNQVGYFNEARDAAAKLRPESLAQATPEHVPVLIEEINARLALKADDPALDGLTSRLVELVPNSNRALFLRIGFLQGVKRYADASALVKQRLEAHPDDAILGLMSVGVRPDGSQPLAAEMDAAARKAAGLGTELPLPKLSGSPAYSDVETAFQIVSIFDALKQHACSLQVLRDAASRFNSETAQRLFVRRAWSMGLNEDVLKASEPAAPGTPVHTELLVFRVLVLRDTGDLEKAKPAADEIASRTRDFRAKAWIQALRPLLDKAPDADMLKGVDAALKDFPGEPLLAFLRAEYLARLGRTDEARALWTAIARGHAVPGWVTPAVRKVDTLIGEGRLDEALAAAAEAVSMDPNSQLADFVYAHVLCLMLEAQRPIPNSDAMLKLLDKKLAKLDLEVDKPGVRSLRDSLVPGRVALLATMGSADDARALTRTALSWNPRVPADVLRRLAIVSTRFGLGVENECIAAAGDGKSEGDIVMAQAMVQYRQGDKAAALALLKQHVDAAPPAEREVWEVSRAMFLDAVADPGALDAFRTLAQSYPSSLNTQIAVLRSQSAARDRALIDATVDRVTALGGSDRDRPSVTVRLARARAILSGAADSRARDESVALLRSLVTDVPDVLEVRSLLADALLLEVPARGIAPDRVAAMEVLRNAGNINSPDRAPFVLRLAALMSEDGRAKDAATELSRVALDTSIPVRTRSAAIDSLVSMRELEAARVALESTIKDQGPRAEADLVLRHADVLRSLRRDREAMDIYRSLATSDTLEPETAGGVATGLYSLGEEAAARQVMEKLASRKPRSFAGAIAAAMFAERTADAAGVRTSCEEAAALAPTDPRPWLLLGRYHLSRGEHPAAIDAFNRGLKAIPDDAQLAISLQQAIVAQTPEKDVDLAPLIEALQRDPNSAQQAEALKAINDARRSGDINSPAALLAMSERFANSAAAQAFILRRLLAFTPPAVGPALSVATRTQAKFPASPELNELAVSAFALGGDWERMLEAARRWQQQSRSPRADIASAEAQLGLRAPRQAIDQVKAITVPESISDTDRDAIAVLNIRARATALLGDFAGATRLLESRLSSSMLVRTRIAVPLADLAPDAKSLEAWLRACGSHTDASTPQDQFALAGAWLRASRIFPDSAPTFLALARDQAVKIPTTDAGLGTSGCELRSTIFQAMGDLPKAVEASREAVTLAPNSPTAANALARLIIQTDGDPVEAVALARKACDLAPGVQAPRVTLVEALLHASGPLDAPSRPQAAEEALTECRSLIKQLGADPASEWGVLADLANYADQSGMPDVALSLYEKALASRPGPTPVVAAVLQNNAAYLACIRFGADAAKLRAARDQVSAALRVEQRPEYYETLGFIEQSLQNPRDAAAAYRRAMEQNKDSLSARIGLAEALSGGNDAERKEASELIRTVEATPDVSKKLSKARAGQLQKVKTKLGA